MNGPVLRAEGGRKPSRLFICCAGLLLWVLFGSPALLAQFTTASLSGTVIDPSGAAVPKARVKVENTGTGFTRTTASGNGGDYLFPVLPVGEYTLTVVASGFQTYTQKGIIHGKSCSHAARHSKTWNADPGNYGKRQCLTSVALPK